MRRRLSKREINWRKEVGKEGLENEEMMKKGKI